MQALRMSPLAPSAGRVAVCRPAVAVTPALKIASQVSSRIVRIPRANRHLKCARVPIPQQSAIATTPAHMYRLVCRLLAQPRLHLGRWLCPFGWHPPSASLSSRPPAPRRSNWTVWRCALALDCSCLLKSSFSHRWKLSAGVIPCSAVSKIVGPKLAPNVVTIGFILVW